MAVPQQEIFKKTLSLYGRKDSIYRAVMGAWEDYKTSTEYERCRRKGTRASIVWERMIERAENLFNDADGVQIKEQNDTVSFIFDGRILLRFKKGNPQKRSRSYPTQLALSYHQHDVDLFGFSGIQRAEVIYCLNERQTAIDGVYIVARDAGTLLWEYEIVGCAEKIEALPATPQHLLPSKKHIVRLKETPEKETRKKASNDDTG